MPSPGCESPLDVLYLSARGILMIRGKSNSFGVPYERQGGDSAPTEDELVEYGEDTWEVGPVVPERWLLMLTGPVNPKVHGLVRSVKWDVGSQTAKLGSAPVARKWAHG